LQTSAACHRFVRAAFAGSLALGLHGFRGELCAQRGTFPRPARGAHAPARNNSGGGSGSGSSKRRASGSMAFGRQSFASLCELSSLLASV